MASLIQADGELSHRLWVPAHANGLSFDDSSCDLVPSTGPQPLHFDCSCVIVPILRRLHPPVACAEWLVKPPPATQVIHRIEQLSQKAPLNHEHMYPLDPSLPALLFDPPLALYLTTAHYTSLVERYNEAVHVELRDRRVLDLLALLFLLSWAALIAVPIVATMLLAHVSTRTVAMTAAVGLPVAVVCFVGITVLLYRHNRSLWQPMVRRVLEVVRAANVELGVRYEEAARSSVVEGRGAMPKCCVWRWLTVEGTGQPQPSYTLALVLADQQPGGAS